MNDLLPRCASRTCGRPLCARRAQFMGQYIILMCQSVLNSNARVACLPCMTWWVHSLGALQEPAADRRAAGVRLTWVKTLYWGVNLAEYQCARDVIDPFARCTSRTCSRSSCGKGAHLTGQDIIPRCLSCCILMRTRHERFTLPVGFKNL